MTASEPTPDLIAQARRWQEHPVLGALFRELADRLDEQADALLAIQNLLAAALAAEREWNTRGTAAWWHYEAERLRQVGCLTPRPPTCP